MNIDYATLWCDDSDPVWHKKRIDAMKAHGFNPDNLETNKNEALCEGRYQNNNELLYSIRSIKKHAPWIRKIFIITDNQVPHFLDPADSQIVIINHTDIIPKEHLPLFNSSAIEMFLTQIPDLSECFLMGNDDMFFTGDVRPEDFFTLDKKIIFRGRKTSQKIPPYNQLKEAKKACLCNSAQFILSAKVICKHFTGVGFPFLSHHNIDAYRKSYINEALTDYYKWVPDFKFHTFRHEDDFQRLFFSCYDYAKGRLQLELQSFMQEKLIKRGYFTLARFLKWGRTPKLESIFIRLGRDLLDIERIKQSQTRFLCINDTSKATENDRENLKQFLETLFSDENKLPRVLIMLNGRTKKSGTPGGIAHFIADHAKMMDWNKVNIDLLKICKKGAFFDHEGWLESQLKDKNSRFFSLPRIDFFETFLMSLLPSFIKNIFPHSKEKQYLELFKQYKVIHFHDTRNVRYLFNLAKRAGVQCRIVHAHRGESLIKNRISRTLKRCFLGAIPATHFWGCSDIACQHSFGQKMVKEGLTENIKNAIICENFAFNEEKRLKIRDEFKIEDDTFLIGHIGRMDFTQKNQSFLIDIFAELIKQNQKSKLLLIGDGETRQILEEKVRCLRLEKSVIFTGTRIDADAIYSALDFFVLPSFHEGLPIVGVEAQASGLPILFSDSISREAQIRNPLQFLSLKASPSQWAKTILEMRNIKNNRRDAIETLRQDGWDLKENAHLIGAFYIEQHHQPNSKHRLYAQKINVAQVPLVSVVMPVYNVQEDFLRACFDSVLNQSMGNFELIVVNDASTASHCAQIIDHYAQQDKRIQVITHPINRGLAAARNTGIDVAQGSYLIFIDSDDFWLPNLLEKTTQTALETESEVLCFGLQRFSTLQSIIPFEEKSGSCDVKRVQRGSVTAWSKLYLRSTVEKLRFAESVRYSEDIPYYIEVFNLAKVIYKLDYNGYLYRKNPHSIMSVYKTTQGILNLLTFFDYMLSLNEKISSDSKARKLYQYHFGLRLFSSLKYIQNKGIPSHEKQIIWETYRTFFEANETSLRAIFPWYIPVFTLKHFENYRTPLFFLFIIFRCLISITFHKN